MFSHTIFKTTFRISLAFLVLSFVSQSHGQKLKKPAPLANSKTIQGTVAQRGVTCPRFTLNTGETVSLAGRKLGLRIGAKLKLHGKWAMASTCMQGRTFIIERSVTLR